MLKNAGIKYYFYLIFILFFQTTAFANKRIVSSNLQYNFHKAKPYDTLIIRNAVYICDSLVIDKPMKIIGENFPILSGNKKNQILIIKANGVEISGIKFVSSGISFIKDNSAIKLSEVSDCYIHDNIFENNFFAIYLAKSKNCKIIRNKITAHNKRQTFSGNGIHLWYCKNILIEKNEVTGHRDGIYLEFVRKSKIVSNNCRQNLRYGLHFMFSDSCVYSYNTFEKNIAGVAVMYTKNVLMTHNNFLNNWGNSSYGLLLKEIADSKIISNKFIENSNGIYFESCSRIEIGKNLFSSNGWAIRLMANSMDNKFEKNNFISNSFDVSTNSRSNYNFFNNNYWSEYNGYDLNRDGIGDVPFRPVKLFSSITENTRPALILLNSLFVNLLNFAEKVFPLLTPKDLIDNQPLMRKYDDRS